MSISGKYKLILATICTSIFLPFATAYGGDESYVRLSDLQCRADLALQEEDYLTADDLAQTIISEVFDASDEWYRGNALHHGYRIRGLVAARNKKFEEAKGHLLNSAITHLGSPQLNSFGPNMLLAKVLLEQGEKDFVLEYLKLCKRFWDREELTRWSMEIQNGKIPNFGPHLSYGVNLPGSRVCPNQLTKAPRRIEAGENNIVGQWRTKVLRVFGAKVIYLLIFNPDKSFRSTVTFNPPQRETFQMETKGSYEINSNEIEMFSNGRTHMSTYSIQDEILEIDDGNEVFRYERVQPNKSISEHHTLGQKR